MVRKTPVDAGLADPLGNADDEHQNREQHHADTNIEGDVSFDSVNGEGRRRVGQEEQTNDRDPKHPPGHRVAAPFIGEPASQGTDNAGRQYKEQGDECRRRQLQAVFRDVVFGQPQGKRHEPTKNEVVGKTVPPHPGLPERREHLAECRYFPLPLAPLELGIRVGKEPKDDSHHQHRHGVDRRHRAPAQGHDDQRRDEDVQCRAGVAGAENAQHRALPLFLEPGGGVGDADGK